jgi:protein tyrosine/serine phosphatase
MTCTNTLSIKVRHEESSAHLFLENLNKARETAVIFSRRGDPVEREPDVLCSGGLDIELVGIYDNAYQAKKIWSFSHIKADRIYGPQEYKLLSFGNLENEIAKKLTKLNEGLYSGSLGKLILVCNLHSPLLQNCEVERYVNSYVPFRSDGFFERYFDEIWVSWKSENDGVWKIKQLE